MLVLRQWKLIKKWKHVFHDLYILMNRMSDGHAMLHYNGWASPIQYRQCIDELKGGKMRQTQTLKPSQLHSSANIFFPSLNHGNEIH